MNSNLSNNNFQNQESLSNSNSNFQQINNFSMSETAFSISLENRSLAEKRKLKKVREEQNQSIFVINLDNVKILLIFFR